MRAIQFLHSRREGADRKEGCSAWCDNSYHSLLGEKVSRSFAKGKHCTSTEDDVRTSVGVEKKIRQGYDCERDWCEEIWASSVTG